MNIQSYLQRWETLNCSVIISQKGIDEINQKLGLWRRQWVARQSLGPWKNFKALKRGPDAFLCMYVDRWS